MGENAAFVYSDALTRHVLSDNHPLKAVRLRYTYELLAAYGVFESTDAMLLEPRPATEAELLRSHTQPYLECVQRLSRGDYSGDPAAFGFGPGDNPIYEGMYEASALSTGASLRAAEVLLSGEADRAFSISGGLHHAMPGNASGFCVFNDPVVAIEELLLHGMKVAYVDIDCHHGDGVQHAFYDTDAVLTISVHESGAYLFPGTGFTQETGTGKGRGYSVNLPLYPYTMDEVYLRAFREVVPPLLEAYKPDVIVTQLGIDSHFRDPITHMALTVQGIGQAVSSFAGAAPKWLALGGGGYDLQAVARAWTTAYSLMLDRDLPDEIPEPYGQTYGVSTLSDHDTPPSAEAHQQDARTFAENSVQALHREVFPTHGLRGA
jgi:acetoin utilization protein AcuC